MSSPTQGMWTCQHGVDGRDWCPDCCSCTARPPGRWTYELTVTRNQEHLNEKHEGMDLNAAEDGMIWTLPTLESGESMTIRATEVPA